MNRSLCGWSAAWCLVRCVAVSIAMSVAVNGLARDGEPGGSGGSGEPLDQPKSQRPALDQLEPGEGVVWGDWIVWRNREREPRRTALFLQHPASKQVVYVWSGSNGWINFRTSAGEWYLKLSQGRPEKQDRKDLKVNDYLNAKPGERRLNFGVTRLGNWNIKLTAEQMELINDESNDRLTLKADSGVFTHNGRRLGENPPRKTEPTPMPTPKADPMPTPKADPTPKPKVDSELQPQPKPKQSEPLPQPKQPQPRSDSDR